MALVLRSAYNYYIWLFQEYQDARVEKYPLLGSPVFVLSIMGIYLMTVLKWGPEYMKNRKPYDLKNILIFYNLLQMVFNLIIWVIAMYNSYLRSDFSMMCQPLDPYNNQPHMQKLIEVTYYYYLTKYLDLLDTIFFVLRKKNNQITFLHVYHHAGMVFATYIFTKFLSGSHSTLLGVINAFVHVVMYGYYFLTSISKDSNQYFWMKKRVTQIQLLQFAYLIFHFMLPLANNYCNHPKLISFIGLIQNLFMFSLFFDFYYKQYLRKKTKV